MGQGEEVAVEGCWLSWGGAEGDGAGRAGGGRDSLIRWVFTGRARLPGRGATVGSSGEGGGEGWVRKAWCGGEENRLLRRWGEG